MNKTNIKRRSERGFTLLEIMIVVALIATLAVIAIPQSVQARTRSQRNACISNLRHINHAIQQWALETKAQPNAAVTEADVTPYLKNPAFCPSGGITFGDSYIVTRVSADPVCQKVPLTHIAP